MMKPGKHKLAILFLLVTAFATTLYAGGTVITQPIGQQRVTGTCASPNAIVSIAANGTVTCSTGAGGFSTAGAGLTSTGLTLDVGAGTGITVNPNDVAIDPTYTQRRVSSTCAAGSSIRVVNSDGTVTCETDDDTTYTNGTGLSLTGTTFAVAIAGGTCSTNTVGTALSATGTLTCAAPPVFTTSATGYAPASGGGTTNFLRADGTWTAPIGTTYTASTGLTLTSTAFSVTTNGITNALLRQSGALSVVGNSTNATANVADITASSDGDVLRRSGTTLGFGAIPEASVTSLVTDLAAKVPTTRTISTTTPLSGGGDLSANRTLLITTNGIDNTLIRQGVATSVIGVTGSITANEADIAASADGQILRRAAGALGFGTVPSTSITGLAAIATSGSATDLTAGTVAAARMPALTGDVTTSAGAVATTIANNAVTYAKMQDVSATNRFLGRITALAGDPEELTGTQATTLLDTFTTSLKGLAPASGGGTTTFLRADGSWAAPVGTTYTASGGITLTSTNFAITSAGVTNAMLATMGANTIKGNNTGGAAAPLDLTATQVTAMLDTFATAATTKGLVPGSNSAGATAFLNGNGGWTVPAGTGVTGSGFTTNRVVKATGGSAIGDTSYPIDDAAATLTLGDAATDTTLNRGALGVGHSAIGPTLSGTPVATFVTGSVNGLTGGVSIDRASADANAANLYFYKTRATDPNVQTSVANSDVIGNTSYFATDGTTIQQLARIRAVVNGTVSAGVVPTDIVFQTSATNTAGITTALTIKSDQSLLLAGQADMASHKIVNVTNGASAQDAAAFGQIATAVNAAVSGTSGTYAKFIGTNAVGNGTLNEVAAGVITAGVNAAYFSDAYGLNFDYGDNISATGNINLRGYQAGITQYRDLVFGDGKGATACSLTASTKTLNCVGGLQVNGTSVPTTGTLTTNRVVRASAAGAIADTAFPIDDSAATLTLGDANTDGTRFNGSIGVNVAPAAGNPEVYILPANGGTGSALYLESSDGKQLRFLGQSGSSTASISATNDVTIAADSSVRLVLAATATTINGLSTDTLTLHGATSIDATLGVTGNTTLSGTLHIVSTTQADNNVAVTGTVTATSAVGATFIPNTPGLVTSDSTTSALGVGGAIVFDGKYTSGGSIAVGAGIKALKASDTDSNQTFDLALGGRSDADAGPAESMRLFGAGVSGAGKQFSVGGTSQFADSLVVYTATTVAANWLKSTDGLTDSGLTSGTEQWIQVEATSTIATTTASITSPRNITETVLQLTCTNGGTACTAGGSDYRFVGQNGGTSAGSIPYTDARNKTITWSVWVKRASGTGNLRLMISRYNDTEETTLDCPDTSASWTRCAYTKTLSNTALTDNSEIRVKLQPRDTTTIYLFGAQLEEATGPTSYKSKTVNTRPAAALIIPGLGASTPVLTTFAWAPEMHIASEPYVTAEVASSGGVGIYGSTGTVIGTTIGARSALQSDGTLTIKSTSDLQGAIANSAGTLSLSDDVSIGASTSSAISFTNGPSGINRPDGKHFEYLEQYTMVDVPGNGTIIGWHSTALSSGTFAMTASSGNRLGILAGGTGASAAGRVGDCAALDMMDLSLNTTSTTDTVVGFPTLSNSTDRYQYVFGFIDVRTSPNQTDGCYFSYDEGSTASNPTTGDTTMTAANTWKIWCASNGTRTGYMLDGTGSDDSFTTVNETVAAQTLPNTNTYGLRIVMDAATKAHFWMNTGSGWVEVGRITSNIPTGTSRTTGVGWLLIKSVGTTARTANVDWWRWSGDITSPSAPN